MNETQQKPKSDLVIMKEMVDANMDIIACPDFVRADKDKKGGVIGMGVPEALWRKSNYSTT